MRIALVSRFPRVDALAWKRTLAERLLERGVEVALLYSRSAIVDQASAGLREFGFGVVGRYLDRGNNHPSSDQTLDAWALERGLSRHCGRRLGEAETLIWLRKLAPDLVILVGADIVPAALLEIPRLGTINPHYGLLPRYRGMNVTEWSIYYDDPVGVTVHTVDPGIDTGEILLQEALTVPVGATLASIREQQQQVSARLLEHAAMAAMEGATHPTPQRLEDGTQFYRMHPLLRARAERRLADGTYRWLGLTPPTTCEDTCAWPGLRRTV
jgi:methionyl-tRNA formyltransferase